jgi:hypothetical protein
MTTWTKHVFGSGHKEVAPSARPRSIVDRRGWRINRECLKKLVKRQPGFLLSPCTNSAKSRVGQKANGSNWNTFHFFGTKGKREVS